MITPPARPRGTAGPHLDPRRRLGDRTGRRVHDHGVPAGRTGRLRRGQRGLPAGARAPVPGRARRLRRGHPLGARARRRVRRRSDAGGGGRRFRRRQPQRGRGQRGAGRSLPAPRVPGDGPHDVDASPHRRERRRLPADEGGDGVVHRATTCPAVAIAKDPRCRRSTPTTRSSPPRRRPSSSPRSSTRCATRARPTPTAWPRRASPPTKTRYDGQIHAFFVLPACTPRPARRACRRRRRRASPGRRSARA